MQPLLLFARAIMLGELGAEELVDLASTCAADPWLASHQVSLAVRPVFMWHMLHQVLDAIWLSPHQQRALTGEPLALTWLCCSGLTAQHPLRLVQRLWCQQTGPSCPAPSQAPLRMALRS